MPGFSLVLKYVSQIFSHYEYTHFLLISYSQYISSSYSQELNINSRQTEGAFYMTITRITFSSLFMFQQSFFIRTSQDAMAWVLFFAILINFICFNPQGHTRFPVSIGNIEVLLFFLSVMIFYVMIFYFWFDIRVLHETHGIEPTNVGSYNVFCTCFNYNYKLQKLVG